MIDLRSDTISMPTHAMLETILTAQLGDDGRTDENGRGEDLATNELEDFAAEITGKEAGLLFPTGTMANTTAILSVCSPGDKVLVGEIQHIYVTEKAVFDPSYGQLIPVTYRLNAQNVPCLEDIRRAVTQGGVKLITYETTHNFTGGACTPLRDMQAVYEFARENGIPVHLDGARIFNAACAMKTSVKELCRFTDSVMFCLSKGLGSGIGSLLCGGNKFITVAREKRKLFGGAMRQTGIIAAPGMYALRYNLAHLQHDHDNAAHFAAQVKKSRNIKVQGRVDSNIVMLDVSGTGLSPEEFCDEAKRRGLLIRPILGDRVRVVFYRDIDRDATEQAIKIVKTMDEQIKRRVGA